MRHDLSPEETSEVPALLEYLSALAKKSKVKIIGITPGSVERPAVAAQARNGLTSAGTYQEVLRMTGDEEKAARSGEVMAAASGVLNALSLNRMMKPCLIDFVLFGRGLLKNIRYHHT